VPVHHLLHPEDPGVVRPGDEVGGDADVEGDHLRAGGQRGRERGFVEGAVLVVHRERAVREAPQASPLFAQVVG
jgi:hypothetical protein